MFHTFHPKYNKNLNKSEKDINSLKESIINDMCLTYDHAYGLLIDESKRENYICSSGFTKSEQEALYRQMKQIFENCIEPKMTYKNV